MKRILVLGSCGSGKSTFAKNLHDVTGIKIIHLDQHYWKPNWERTEKREWQKKVKELMKGEQWIIDGNYRSTIDMRLPEADTVVWLDFLRLVCLYQIAKRRLKGDRVDKLDGCRERITFELLRWVLWKFPRENRKDILKRLGALKGKKNIIVLKSNKEIKSFFESLQ